MAISAKLLGEDEYVVVSTRTHWKALVLPVLVLLVVAIGGGFLAAIVPPGQLQTPGRLAIGVAGLLLVVVLTARPVLNWLASTYTLTNRRLITRHGILTRTGRDIPLMRINDVSYERGLTDRIFGCGTLQIQSASETGTVVLPDVPHVEQVHLKMSDLLYGGTEPQADRFEEEERPAAPQARRRGVEPDAETLFSSEDDDRRRS